MRTIAFQLVLLALAVALGAPQARATTECDRGYLKGFAVTDEDGRTLWEPGDIECVEYFRFTVSTPGGTRTFRGIGDVNAGPLLRPGDIARVEAGARRAAGNLAALSDYRIDNVTYLVSLIGSDPMSREVLDPDGRRKHAGAAAWTLDPTWGPRRECPVTLFLFGRFSGEDIHYTIAHETFHCVEHGTLSAGQRATMTDGGLWWGEGAAELFAAYNVRRSGWNNAPGFRSAVEAQRPLYAMSYEASIFFYWHYQMSGLGALMPFLRQMASGATDGAQRAAIRGAISDELLLKFAEDFDDGKIKYPNGAALSFGARIDGERWTIDRTTTVRRNIKPFVIMPGWTDYACGKWGNRLTPDGVNAAVREDRATAWTAWPGETDCRTARSLRYRVMALHTGDANASMSLRADRQISCESCLPEGESHIDACLVGTWEMTGGGPMEWLSRRMGSTRFTRNNNTTLRITMNDDGTFSGESVGIDYQTVTPHPKGPIVGDAQARTSRVSGYWSAKDGVMRACDNGVSARGTVTVQTRGITKTVPANVNQGPTNGETRYTCTATNYTSRIQMHDGSTMEYRFRRVTPPPPAAPPR
jgi:hypothetical protein